MNIGGIILAGGKSKRIGRNKCMLTLNHYTLLQIAAETLSIVCKEVIVVAKDYEPYYLTGLEVIVEKEKHQSPLVGLLTGLQESKFKKNLVVACDMPFLHPDSLRLLIKYSSGYDAVLPVISGKPEPLHALYSKDLIPLISTYFEKEDVKLTAFLKEAKVNYLDQQIFESHDPELLSFYNINTEEDYKNAIKIEQSNNR